MIKLLVIHGPNLNLLGEREPNIYGANTIEQINKMILDHINKNSVEIKIFQSNYEGKIIDFIQQHRNWAKGIVINPGAFTHYSYAIRDAISAVDLPTVEVHLSDITKREEFRRISVIAHVCLEQISGLGPKSYSRGIDILLKNIKERKENTKQGTIAVAGIPYDENSSYMQGPAEAPTLIWEALHCCSSNLSTENGIDLTDKSFIKNFKNFKLSTGTIVLQEIEDLILDLLDKHDYIVSLGGDHAITYPVIKAYSKKYSDLNILHLDAHPDLYDELDGNKYSHACSFARILEEKLTKRLVQMGIRTMNPHQLAQAQKFNVEVIDMKKFDANKIFNFSGPLYLSIDMDVLDPAYAPGVSHFEPGGMSVREVIKIIQNINVPIIGADIVEYNPKRDISGVTAMVAAKFLKEIVGMMIEMN